MPLFSQTLKMRPVITCQFFGGFKIEPTMGYRGCVGNWRSWIGAAIESRVVMTGAEFQSENDCRTRNPEERNPHRMIIP